jgi:hypothetical protein
MAELTRETLPPAGPDYPLWPDASAPGAPPVIQHKRSAADAAKTRPRVLPPEPEHRSGSTGDES